MSYLLQLSRGSKAYGTKELFQNASFTLNEGEHVGVIGPNGAGKTTLFKVLIGSEELDSGDVIRAGGLRVGYLAQQDQWAEDETVEDYLSRGCWVPLWDLKALGRGLGISESAYSQRLVELSGGFRMRCKLLHLLGEVPDLLLLDEPTNYLDLESVLVLERFLQDYRKAFLLISHDREFLRRTTDHILEVEAGDIVKFNGSLDDYFEQKALLRTQMEARALSVEQKRREVLDFVARFGAKATKAAQAQSRLKSLAKLEQIDLKPLPQAATIQIPAPVRTGKNILKLEQVDLGYGSTIVLRNISFILRKGEHLAVVGVNGAGKSTFLKALAGHLAPLNGVIELGHEVSIGYYSQYVSEALCPTDTVLEAMGARAHSEVTPQQVLNLAGALLFSGSDVQKRIAVLSGGEKSRVALGQILLQKAPCLLLDEPTNHLDFQTVEALTQALSQYEGTVIVVSHDRSFIRRVSNRILEINQGRIDFYPGTYDEYVWSCQKGMFSEREGLGGEGQRGAQESAGGGQTTPGAGEPSSPNYKVQKKVLDKELRKLERDLTELDQTLAQRQTDMQALNQKIATEPHGAEVKTWIDQIAKYQQEIESCEERWFQLSSRKEELLALMVEGRQKG